MSSSAISDPAPFHRVLITGGAGFVGSRLVPLLAAKAQVAVVDDLSVGLPMPQAAGVACHRVDVRDHGAIMALAADFRPDLVVHLAALHHIPTCQNNPSQAMSVNVMGFQAVLDACSAAGCGKVVLASSGAVYAWADGALDEDAAMAPCDVYSASKAANEHQLAAWSAATGGAGLVARMFNVIGPGDPNGHLIPDILNRLDGAAAGNVTLALGNLTTRRDFVDVDDMAAGLAALAACPARGVEVFNLCSGRDYTSADIARLLAAELGVAVDIVSDPALCRRVDRPSQLGNPAKALAALGWRTERPLAHSVAAIVRAWRGRNAAPCA